MMGWGTLRKATDEDRERLAQRAEEFCARHDLEYDKDLLETPLTAIERATDPAVSDEVSARRLRRLWLAVLRRALREPQADGIAYGYVGYHVD